MPARYRFDIQERYFATVVGVRPYDLPSIDKSMMSLVKVTLATPFVLCEDDSLRVSRRMEAVVWVRDEGAGSRFLDKAGVVRDGDNLYPPIDAPRLWCRFMGPAGRDDYQALDEWGTLLPGTYSVEPVVVATRASSGLAFEGETTVTWRGVAVVLTPLLTQILRVLDKHFMRTVSRVQLRRDVEEWRQKVNVQDVTINVAVGALRAALREQLPSKLDIPKGRNGWRLVPVS